MPQPEASILWVEGKDDLHAIGHLLSRGGDHVTREPQEVINERKQVYRRVGYEQRFRTDATLDDLDPAFLLFARAPALRWHPRAGLRLFRVAGTSRQHGRRRNVTQVGRADPPLARAIRTLNEQTRQLLADNAKS